MLASVAYVCLCAVWAEMQRAVPTVGNSHSVLEVTLPCVGGATVLHSRTQGAALLPSGDGSWLLSLRTQSLSL